MGLFPNIVGVIYKMMEYIRPVVFCISAITDARILNSSDDEGWGATIPGIIGNDDDDF